MAGANDSIVFTDLAFVPSAASVIEESSNIIFITFALLDFQQNIR